jgi:hypothetical protein
LAGFGLTTALIAIACGGGAGPSAPASALVPSSQTPTTLIPSTRSPSGSPLGVATIVGSWHRAEACEEMKAAFERLGLAETHREWLAGNFFIGRPIPSSGDVCAGAISPVEHQHDFSASGAFSSRDDHGKQVDDGEVRIEATSLSFPSHATEFGYAGDLRVSYAIADNVATFGVSLPAACDGPCRDAYAWAASAFVSGPWQRGTVP